MPELLFEKSEWSRKLRNYCYPECWFYLVQVPLMIPTRIQAELISKAAITIVKMAAITVMAQKENLLTTSQANQLHQREALKRNPLTKNHRTQLLALRLLHKNLKIKCSSALWIIHRSGCSGASTAKIFTPTGSRQPNVVLIAKLGANLPSE